MAMKRGACIESMYRELPFLERFQAAKKDGFDYVEFWEWRNKDLDAVRMAASDASIGICGFNGDADYSLIDPSQKADYLAALQRSVEAAKYVGALSVTIHSNALGEGGLVVHDYKELSDTVKLCSMYGTLIECAKIAEDSDIKMNLEPLNIKTDHIGNFLIHTQMAAEMTRLISSPMLKVLYDVYHMQLNEGDICNTISTNIDQIGHVHIADVPGRHEPGTGEVHYTNIYACLAKNGYSGIVGYELFPLTTTEAAVRAIFAD
ncbi:MAG: TIM barrel protein [Oscillospiraceae bacterium]